MVQPRKVKGSDKNKAIRMQQEQVDASTSKNIKKTKKGLDNKKKHHVVATKKTDNFYNPFAERRTEEAIVNPNLTKKDLKKIEKIHAKIEYHEIRDEHAEVEKLRTLIVAVEEKANAKAIKISAAAAMA